jgi:hypothetical protein
VKQNSIYNNEKINKSVQEVRFPKMTDATTQNEAQLFQLSVIIF